MVEKGRGRLGGCLGRIAALGVVGVAVAAVVVLAVSLGTWMLYRQHVVVEPGAHMERDAVRSIIAQESPVYYRDGTTRVGVFFEDEHRQFVPWERLPRPYVMAIVAAEDGRFWSHPGVSGKHLARAMRDNVLAGGVVAGGSTLTQQTAKNLYYRPDRSLRSKWTELINALRLEAHYDKHEILTFYVNQFHVSGNGRGLGIAARYFFDKDVDELDVAECAFLAGLVKSPYYYDPFIGDADRRERSRERSRDRTAYVLQRIVDESAEHLVWPDVHGDESLGDRGATVRDVKAEAERLLREGFELDFKRGTFRYASSAVLDEVARRLAEPPFDEVLEAAGIDDPATAGLVVVTTLDPDAQREAQYALWHHLTEVGAWLEGYGAERYLVQAGGPVYDPDRPIIVHEYRLARVVRHLRDEGPVQLEVDLGGRTCVVDRDAIVRATVASVRGRKKDKYAKAKTAEVDAFAEALTDGAVVTVSVRSVGADGSAVCDLETRPDLQGAVAVVQDGELRAMVAGNDNRNFNRVGALRQMGSTWKLLVYHGAIGLGWTPTDELDNRRNIFPFSGTPYYPRPDHDPPPVVSMSWAGVNSENLASIWLLYHLTDRLPADRVAELAVSLDLARRPGEEEKAYARRIQEAGVLPTRGRVAESLFLQARHEVAEGPLDHPEDRLSVRSLLYGWGFDAERAAAARLGPKTRAQREQLLENSWTHMLPSMQRCVGEYRNLERALASGEVPAPGLFESLTFDVAAEGPLPVACGRAPEGYVPIGEAWERLSVPSDKGRKRFPWSRLTEAVSAAVVPVEDVLVDDRLHVSTLRALESSVRRRQLTREALGADAPGLYEPEVLYWHQDFRLLMNIRLMTRLAAQYGVSTDIAEVMSIPLGASEITLEEATVLYEGLTTGVSWSFLGQARGPGDVLWNTVARPDYPALLISEIRDVDGKALYRAKPESRRVASPEVAAATADILRNVVRFGTGRRAMYAVKEGSAQVPLGGKTGTTNDFRNAAFLGFVPAASPSGYTVDDGYTVGVYVGYDDNTSMSSGNIRLAGSGGALPAWIGTAAGLHAHGLLNAPAAVTTEVSWPLLAPTGMVRVAVDPETGRMPDEPLELTMEGPSVLTTREGVEASLANNAVEPTSRPVRAAPRQRDGEGSRGGSVWRKR